MNNISIYLCKGFTLLNIVNPRSKHGFFSNSATFLINIKFFD